LFYRNVNISNFSFRTIKRQSSEILDTQEYLHELPKHFISVGLAHSMLVWISFDLIISVFHSINLNNKIKGKHFNHLEKDQYSLQRIFIEISATGTEIDKLEYF